MILVVKPSALRFECLTSIEQARVKTILTKEAGTIAWLKTLGPDDLLYDVGANIGLYTLYAAQRGVRVYAFEPHVGNAASLLRNISLNPEAARLVTVLTIALDETEGYAPFNYHSHVAGSSRHQLGNTTLEDGGEFTPVASERKYTTPMDRLASVYGFQAPTAVKIDVDGNEMRVLRGMESSLKHLRTLQVEVHPNNREVITEYLASQGLHLSHRHHTANGKAALARGVTEDAIPHNAVYQPLNEEAQHGGE